MSSRKLIVFPSSANYFLQLYFQQFSLFTKQYRNFCNSVHTDSTAAKSIECKIRWHNKQQIKSAWIINFNFVRRSFSFSHWLYIRWFTNFAGFDSFERLSIKAYRFATSSLHFLPPFRYIYVYHSKSVEWIFWSKE